jgi:hypothetical protein
MGFMNKLILSGFVEFLDAQDMTSERTTEEEDAKR